MWTKEEAIEYVQKKWLPSGNECKGESFSFVDDESELWEHGWILSFLQKETGRWEQYVADKRYKICHPVGTRGIRPAIRTCLERTKNIDLEQE